MTCTNHRGSSCLMMWLGTSLRWPKSTIGIGSSGHTTSMRRVELIDVSSPRLGETQAIGKMKGKPGLVHRHWCTQPCRSGVVGTDANWAGDRSRRTSTSAGSATIGHIGKKPGASPRALLPYRQPSQSYTHLSRHLPRPWAFSPLPGTST